jgi:type VI secretion system ImpA family protein
MATASPVIDELLNPISPDRPAGEDLRWTADWDRIKEARRSDDALEAGKWAKKEVKTANWRQVRELTYVALRERTKDLQLALWLTEASLRLEGFAGLRDGLLLVRELLVRYWDQGLYPLIEDGPEDRAGPFQWLNEKLKDVIETIPITARSDPGDDYSLLNLIDAREVGSESSWKSGDGYVDDDKKRAYDIKIASGHVSMEMVMAAIKGTKRADYEQFSSVFRQTYDAFVALEKVIDEKFGDEVPNMAACRSVLRDVQREVAWILDQIPVPIAALASGSKGTDTGTTMANPMVLRFPLSSSGGLGGSAGVGTSWHDAEILIHSGEVDRGLAEMARLAALETSGRNRFQRKLLLAEVCLATKRERLARSILEELAEQVDKFQLDSWESSELIGRVWIKLHLMYKRGEGGSEDSDRAAKLFERLCRLDPWQALACGE